MDRWCVGTTALQAFDAITLTQIEEYGIDRLLDELAAELKEGRWRPLPARRVFIPKPGTHDAVRAQAPDQHDGQVREGV
nr:MULTISPECIES: hypothetical protein [Streptomyces]